MYRREFIIKLVYSDNLLEVRDLLNKIHCDRTQPFVCCNAREFLKELSYHMIPSQGDYVDGYSVTIVMYAYYVACKWDKFLSGKLKKEESKIVQTCCPGWTLKNWQDYFSSKAKAYSLWLKSDGNEVHISAAFKAPVRLDMSTLLYHQHYCNMLYCVSKMFEETGNDRYLKKLQERGFVVDCYIINNNYANTKLLLEAIREHSREEMSYLFVAWAFLVVCKLRKSYAYKVDDLHTMLNEKIAGMTDYDFTNWMREVQNNKDKYCTMFTELTQDVLDKVLKLAKNAHKSS